jgi:hypothetical protein
VKGDPTPVGFLIIGDPVPAIVIRVDPVADRIGTPAARQVGRHPNFAETAVAVPRAIRFERCPEIERNLLRGGRSEEALSDRLAKQQHTYNSDQRCRPDNTCHDVGHLRLSLELKPVLRRTIPQILTRRPRFGFLRHGVTLLSADSGWRADDEHRPSRQID